jgi:uncharacterized membrane protein YdjX (TVP38/TMEM64 family)
MRRYLKTIVALAWASLLAVSVALWLRTDLALDEAPERLQEWLAEFGLLRAAGIYVVLYALRPLVLFPATLLTVASGLVFGPWLGIVFTIVGENASANVAFGLARWLGRDWIGAHAYGTILRWDRRLRENALVGVLLMRLVYLPFDAVNYGCGLSSMRHRDYFIGTFLGILPGLVSFVLLGGAASARVEHRLFVFAGALVFFVLGLVLARRLRRLAPAEPE